MQPKNMGSFYSQNKNPNANPGYATFEGPTTQQIQTQEQKLEGLITQCLRATDVLSEILNVCEDARRTGGKNLNPRIYGHLRAQMNQLFFQLHLTVLEGQKATYGPSGNESVDKLLIDMATKLENEKVDLPTDLQGYCKYIQERLAPAKKDQLHTYVNVQYPFPDLDQKKA